MSFGKDFAKVVTGETITPNDIDNLSVSMNKVHGLRTPHHIMPENLARYVLTDAVNASCTRVEERMHKALILSFAQAKAIDHPQNNNNDNGTFWSLLAMEYILKPYEMDI